MQKRVDITIENQIAHVRMVRSDKMNALDNDMMEAMIAAGERLKNEAGLRAVVLSGEGRAFCAGLDMGNFRATADKAGSAEKVTRKPLTERTHGQANMPQKVACVWREIGVRWGSSMTMATLFHRQGDRRGIDHQTAIWVCLSLAQKNRRRN